MKTREVAPAARAGGGSLERMRVRRHIRLGVWLLAVVAAVCPLARAAEHVTLKNGFEFDCVRREAYGERVRLYLMGSKSSEAANYFEVAASAIVKVEAVADAVPALPVAKAAAGVASTAAAGVASTAAAGVASTAAAGVASTAAPTAAEMTLMLSRAGEQHHLDADMLASVIKAESGGHVRAVSRTGARGLMQLMPGTATQLGVKDSFQADQNIAGGTAYFDQLMTRYHDNVAYALAAYNAGPGAVDRWHGIPPYRETQAYVVRVIREFNRRKMLALTASAQ